MTKRPIRKKNNQQYNDRRLIENIRESITDYINSNATGNSTVEIGQCFSEWVLSNIFDLREDEIIEATEISGQSDNGIDAIFEIYDELYVVQCKYNNSHSTDSLIRFSDDCERLLTEQPITDRQIVKEKCKLIREKYQNEGKIKCYYVTSYEFDELDKIRIAEKEKYYRLSHPTIETNYFDIGKIIDWIREKNSDLPSYYKQKKFNLNIKISFPADNTLIGMTSLKNFYRFVKDGGNLLYQSNIRNYLKQSKINRKIKETLINEPDKFWYFNNGVTIVCENFQPVNKVIVLAEPQIVNGCQTSKTIAEYFDTLSQKEVDDIQGDVLVKIIQTRSKDNEEDKKLLKDKITRYTNSQNSVRGLDFYSLDHFQRELKNKFEHYGYYYEIQRGAFATLDKTVKQKYKGKEEYRYLVPSNYDFMLPAKEVMQTFTAGIIQLPNIAYGKPGELTPVGDHWDKICNEDTAKLETEHYLLPFLVFQYAKSYLGYSRRSKKDQKGVKDFRKAASLLFVTTYYLVFLKIMNLLYKNEYEKPQEIPIEKYKLIFSNQDINVKLLNTTHKVLYNYFRESTIYEKYVGQDIKDFLKITIKKKEPWSLLERQVRITFEDNFIDDEDKILIDMITEALQVNTSKEGVL